MDVANSRVACVSLCNGLDWLNSLINEKINEKLEIER